MDPASILEAQEMERSRTPAELRAWVDAICRAFAATDETKAYSRSGARLPKKFFDEIFPLSLLATHDYPNRPDVRVTPSLDNDNFDARIDIDGSAGTDTRFIETTFAKDGYDDSLRMEALTKEGHVFMTGNVSVRGRRGAADRVVRVEPMAVNHAVEVDRYLDLVERRVAAKAKASYGPTHTLLVAIDDYPPLHEDGDWGLLRERARQWLTRYELDFDRVAFVGVSGRRRLVLHCPGTRKASEANSHVRKA